MSITALLTYRVGCDHCAHALEMADTGVEAVVERLGALGWTVTKASAYRSQTRRWGTDYADIRCRHCQEDK